MTERFGVAIDIYEHTKGFDVNYFAWIALLNYKVSDWLSPDASASITTRLRFFVRLPLILVIIVCIVIILIFIAFLDALFRILLALSSTSSLTFIN
jgi:hypothetical protein